MLSKFLAESDYLSICYALSEHHTPHQGILSNYELVDKKNQLVP